MIDAEWTNPGGMCFWMKLTPGFVCHSMSAYCLPCSGECKKFLLSHIPFVITRHCRSRKLFFKPCGRETLCEAGRLPAPRKGFSSAKKKIYFGTGGYASRRRLSPHAVNACHARFLAWLAGKRPAGAGALFPYRVGGAPAWSREASSARKKIYWHGYRLGMMEDLSDDRYTV
jgi:hypothetical protein